MQPVWLRWKESIWGPREFSRAHFLGCLAVVPAVSELCNDRGDFHEHYADETDRGNPKDGAKAEIDSHEDHLQKQVSCSEEGKVARESNDKIKNLRGFHGVPGWASGLWPRGDSGRHVCLAGECMVLADAPSP